MDFKVSKSPRDDYEDYFIKNSQWDLLDQRMDKSLNNRSRARSSHPYLTVSIYVVIQSIISIFIINEMNKDIKKNEASCFMLLKDKKVVFKGENSRNIFLKMQDLFIMKEIVVPNDFMMTSI